MLSNEPVVLSQLLFSQVLLLSLQFVPVQVSFLLSLFSVLFWLSFVVSLLLSSAFVSIKSSKTKSSSFNLAFKLTFLNVTLIFIISSLLYTSTPVIFISLSK